MAQEVILVVVDVSNEISSDYAMEWTIQNVTKSDDFIILLVVLPRPNLYQRLKSLACYFLSCGGNHSKGNSFDQSKRDALQQTIYEYVHKMQKLCLANNLMQVHFKVKVIVDAEVGSIATKGKETEASWIILDRFHKKEVGHCIKQLNSNVVLIDHAIPRIIKAVIPMTKEKFSRSKSQSKPTEISIPYILDDKIAKSPSSSDFRSSTFRTYSFSLPATDKEYHCKTNPCNINHSHDFLYLNSEYFDEDIKMSGSNIDELNRKSVISLPQGEAEIVQWII